jgi:LAS superfamily LD-carboxypeptidase LdcB
MAEAFVRDAQRETSGLVVTSARRTHKEQLRLYQEFLAGRNNGLPATPPGHSDHEQGLAFDFARLNVDPLTDPVLFSLGARWKAQGGKWWAGDPVHFSAPQGWGARGSPGRSRRRTRSSRHR